MGLGVVAGIGLGLNVLGGIKQAKATKKAGQAQQEAAMSDAAMVEEATRQADAEAREQIRRQRIADRSFRGSQRAAIAGAGVVGTMGSPLDILGRTAALQELHVQDMARAASSAYSQGFSRARTIRLGGAAAASGARSAAAGQLIATGAQTATGIATAIDRGYFG